MTLHYEEDADILMILFAPVERSKTVYYLPSGLGLLIDDETGGIIGFQIEGFEKQLHRLSE